MSDAFLNAIGNDPKEQTSRLVYADWLEEQGDPDAMAKAEFLRLTVEEATERGAKGKKKARRKRLQELAATLDTDWLAIVSRMQIENCPNARPNPLWKVLPSRIPLTQFFHFACDQQWDELQTTADEKVRFCTTCDKTVHYCDTILEAREQAKQQHCIAIDLGVIRREGDLRPRRIRMGKVTAKSVQREIERLKPDPVSEERERQKRQRKK